MSDEIQHLDSLKAPASVPAPTWRPPLLRKVFLGPYGLRARWERDLSAFLGGDLFGLASAREILLRQCQTEIVDQNLARIPHQGLQLLPSAPVALLVVSRHPGVYAQPDGACRCLDCQLKFQRLRLFAGRA